MKIVLYIIMGLFGFYIALGILGYILRVILKLIRCSICPFKHKCVPNSFLCNPDVWPERK